MKDCFTLLARIEFETSNLFRQRVETQNALPPNLVVVLGAYVMVSAECSRWRDGSWLIASRRRWCMKETASVTGVLDGCDRHGETLSTCGHVTSAWSLYGAMSWWLAMLQRWEVLHDVMWWLQLHPSTSQARRSHFISLCLWYDAPIFNSPLR